MLYFFLSALLTLCIADEVHVVMQEGVFNYPFVFDDQISHAEDTSALFVTTAHRCVTSFLITADVKSDCSLTLEFINGVEDDKHTWKMIGEATLLKGEGARPVYLFPSPVCASTWKFVVYSPLVNFQDISMTSTDAPAESKKRQSGTSCFFDATALYPPDCSSASEGARCMNDGNCGCTKDTDCFNNQEYPYCNKPASAAYGACDRCTVVEASPTTGNKDHYFCFSRYPGLKLHPTKNTSLPSEEVAPDNFWREVCVRTPVESSGSCQRCNQAPFINFNFTSRMSNQGASGTVHCNKIKPTKPICMDPTYMQDTGATFDRNLNGACVPCTTNPTCARGLPATPICVPASGSCVTCKTNTECSTIPWAKNCQKDGSCFTCKSDADCGAKDGGEKGDQVTCNVGTGICEDAFKCTTNPSCGGKGGNNCQASGSCLTCKSNADCGALDGGEVKGQQVCNVASGLCGTCSANKDCVGTSGNNCQANGLCVTCKSNADCGAGDGGETAGQPICNIVSGICEAACANNNDCTSKSGKNCQKDGTCVSCVNDATCGNLDGGENQNQPKCNPQLNICITPFTCTTNPSCQGNGGANCQKDGSCVSCTNATCGGLDGGDVKDQPNCNLNTRICLSACTKNADCVGTQGNNCQKTGICQTCKSDSDCRGVDGGEVADQPICNIGSGICEAACKSNKDCVGKPGGPNCQKDGTCTKCASAETCGVKDGGEITDQPVCRKDGICDYCSANSDCPQNAPNCGSDGICYRCTDKTCGERDGPPKGPFNLQPHCDAEVGICVDTCTKDEHCPDSCYPHCNVDKGCCSECVEDDHCPHANWRDEEATLNVCSSGLCVAGCAVDEDCARNEADLLACSPTEAKCVECVFDSHCSDEEKPACSVGEQKCVECVTDDHCGEDGECNNNECGGDDGSGGNGIAIAALVLAIIALVLAIIAVVLWVTGRGGLEHV